MRTQPIACRAASSGAGAGVAALLLAAAAHAQTPAEAPNLALGARTTASSVFTGDYGAANAVDGKLSNESRWISKKTAGLHYLTLELSEPKRIGCIQMAGGWFDDGTWTDPPASFVFEYRDGGKWVSLPETDVTGNTAGVVSRVLAKPIETDAIRFVGRDGAEAERVVEIRLYAPAASYPALVLPMLAVDRPEVKLPPVFVNLSGYDTEAPRRFTAPTLADGTPFVLRAVTAATPLYSGKIRGNIGDFSDFRPGNAAAEYVIEAGGFQSDPFRIAPLWVERVSLEPALRFMVDCRSIVGTHPSAYGGSPWRDGTYYSYEVPSLVMLYMANPAFFDNAPVEMSHAADKARILAPTFKPVAANGDKGAIEAARAYYNEIEAPVGARVPDIVQLIHWGIGWHLVKPESADPSGDPVGRRIHPQAVEHFAFFLYGYPHYKQYFSENFYQRAHDFAFDQWEKVGLLDVITKVGDFKGRDAPGHSILPNLMMHEVALREGRPDAARYLDAAVKQARWIVDTLDPADPRVTKGQRMSEHMTITGLTTLLQDYPKAAPTGLRSWLAKWADTVVARSDNLWDFRRYDAENWTLPRYTSGSHGGAGWNEPGNVAGFPACALSVAGIDTDARRAARLRTIGWAHWDDLFGRNPLGAHAAYRAVTDYAGVERGWPRKFPDNVCARLEMVRGTINSTAASEHYPYSPNGGYRHPEGWTAFNASLNVGLAYTLRENTRLSVAPSAAGWSVNLTAPVVPVKSLTMNPVAPALPTAARVTLTTASGDIETIIVSPVSGSETDLTATIKAASGKPVPGDGIVQAKSGETVTAAYGYGRYATRATGKAK